MFFRFICQDAVYNQEIITANFFHLNLRHCLSQTDTHGGAGADLFSSSHMTNKHARLSWRSCLSYVILTTGRG